jgi:shikimate dehydrogenase
MKGSKIMNLPQKAIQPTIYFIGVTTGKSSIMQLFPLWAEALGLKNAVIKGIDIEIHANPEAYREVVNFIKNDPMSFGALITTHKIDLYHAAKDMFDYLDPYAEIFGELSCISKKDGKLEGYAKDPISSGLALEAFMPKDYWKEYGGETFIMGAGGAAIALSAYMIDKKQGDNMPSKLIISNRSEARLEEIKRIITAVNPDINAEFHLTPETAQNDAILKTLSPYSLIANGTGLGKDRPGSPLTDECDYPQNGLVWEFNYRGELDFMHQALQQKEPKGLHVEDGWIYFIHGWTQVIAEVFHIDISGDIFKMCEEIAYEMKRTLKEAV